MEDSSREPENKTIGLGTFVVTCVCATLGLMVSACFMIFNVYHRKNKVVRMSSPNMNIVTSLGGITLSVVCFLYGLEFIFDDKITPLTVLCKIRLWMIILSVTLVFGPVAAKSWRVHEIFKYGLAKKVVIKDGRLFLVLCGLLLVDVILMTLWQTIDPVNVSDAWYLEKKRDADNQSNMSDAASSYLIHECTCAKLEIWVGVLTLWKTAIIVACLFYSWKIRTVPIPSLNDSCHTFSAIFVSVILAFAAAMVTVSLRGYPNAVYVITCAGIAICVVCVQTTLFLPKVKHWWKTPENASPRLSSTSLKNLKDAHASHDVAGDVNGNLYPDDGLVDIVEENKALKESLLEKEDLISTLQTHLDSATQKLAKFPTELAPDTAFDLGLEGVSFDDVYDTLRVVDNPADRSKAYQVELTPRSEQSRGGQKETGVPEQEQTRHKTSLKYTPSISASSRHSFVEEFTDIRQSIADELTNATSINTELKKSLSRDMDRSFSETEWLYERKEPRELAGSIAQSYDLGDNQETITHLNSYLPCENSVFQVRKTRKTSTSSIVSWQSMENVSTKSVEPDNISYDVTSVTRDSATPNSQQHAAILRYYSYRHINDGFMRFQNAFKFNKETDMLDSQSSAGTQASSSVVNVPQRQMPKVITRTKFDIPRDSFV